LKIPVKIVLCNSNLRDLFVVIGGFVKNKILFIFVGIIVILILLFKLNVKEKLLDKLSSKTWIDNETYFVYEFDKRPALGTIILNIKVFDKNDSRNNEFVLTGISGMPDMHGLHDSEETIFRQNKKDDYLLPVNVVMLGEWEIKIKFKKDKKEIFSSKIKFNVK
jgi:hypothetical protein